MFGSAVRNWIGRAPTTWQLCSQVLFSVAITLVVGMQALHAPKRPDFAMIWAAQQTAEPYARHAIDHVLGSTGGHFFPYPPTTLVLTLPLQGSPYPIGYLAWITFSVCALICSLRQLIAPLVLFTPAVFLAAINGQTSLVMGALLLAAASLQGRPILAGLLYGLAACVKPQVGLLIPLLLMAAGQWRTIFAALVTTVVLAAAATLIYGTNVWSDWTGSLPQFIAENDAAWTHRYISLPGPWKLLALGLGAVAAVVAGLRNDLVNGMLICVGAALLGSLHAMDYDAAILAPLAFAAAKRGGLLGAGFLVPPAFMPGRTVVVALMGLALLALAMRSRVQRLEKPSPVAPASAG